MVDQEILKELIGILKSNRCPLENINAETRIEDLELDSVGMTKVLMDLEDHFSVLVTDQIWVKWQDLGEVIEYISNYRKEFGQMNLTEM